jgi:hypothetical protein
MLFTRFDRATEGRNSPSSSLIAERAGHPLAVERLTPDGILEATIKSFAGDEQALVNVIRELIGTD